MKTKNDYGIIIRRKLKILFFGTWVQLSHLVRYLMHSNTDYYKTEDNFAYIITVNYHVIEKGLTMPDMRLGFGQSRLLQLIDDIKQWRHLGFNMDNTQYKQALRVISEYFRVHKENGFELPAVLIEAYEGLGAKENETPLYEKVDAEEYFSKCDDAFDCFSESRHSLRSFDPVSEVSLDKLESAIDLARNTPTPCNRQPNKTIVVTNKETIAKVLDLQGGARGFGHLGDKLLIITSDLSAFAGAREMSEVYKTGGMYAMNLLYALHFNKIGACALQWGEQPKNERILRKLVEIPANENVIMMILVGNPQKEDFTVALSCRNEIEKSLVVR